MMNASQYFRNAGKRILMWLGLIFLFSVFYISVENVGYVHANGGGNAPADQAVGTSAEQDLQAVLERARQVESFRFTADIEEVKVPPLSAATIGLTDIRSETRVEGESLKSGDSRIRLLKEGSFETPELVILRVDGQMFIELNGELTPMEATLDTNLLSSDYLGYLSIASNIQRLEPISTAAGIFERFSYGIDGREMAAYLFAQVQPTLKPGERAQLSPAIYAMSGTGELWISADGLPVRQIMDLFFPGGNSGPETRSHTTVDFYDFGAVSDISAPILDSTTGAWTLPPTQSPTATGWEPSVPDNLRTFMAEIFTAKVVRFLKWGILFLFILTLLVIGLRRWPRQARAAFAIGLAAIFMLTPALQAADSLGLQDALAKGRPVSVDDRPDPTPSPNFPLLPDATQPPVVQVLDNSVPEIGNICGNTPPGSDSDGDGLSDANEICLGTNPYLSDTDQDSIPDKVEIDGFSDGVQTWYGNPLDSDTNQDGVPDASEWISTTVGTLSFGSAQSWDPDMDGVPNLWDADNDGDGVPDSLDISSNAFTDYGPSINLSTTSDGDNSHQYINFQIQPKNLTHLRYSLSALDWPADHLGNIRDLNNSAEDIRLIPMLRVKTTLVPDTTLAEHYGVSIFLNDGPDSPTYPNVMFVPLNPVGKGGSIDAFQGRVAYEVLPSGSSIEWEGELIWQTTVEVDTLQRDGTFDSVPTVYTIFTEPEIRLTGLEITKSNHFENALIGLGSDNNFSEEEVDRQLLNLIFGINAAFIHARNLENQQAATPLLELEDRLAQTGLNIVDRWGLDPNADFSMDVRTYGHADEAFADIRANQTTAFLNSHYTPGDAATLIMAYEETSGVINLNDLGALTPPSINIPQNGIVMITSRGLTLLPFQYASGGWELLESDSLINVLLTRYDDLSAPLANLQAQYPAVTEGELFSLIATFYSTWATGVTNIHNISGSPNPSVASTKTNLEIYNNLFSSKSAIAEYLVEVGNLGQPGGGLAIGELPTENWSYLRSEPEQEIYTGLNQDLGITWKFQEESHNDSDYFSFERAAAGALYISKFTKKVVREAVRAVDTYRQFNSIKPLFQSTIQAGKTASSALWAARFSVAFNILNIGATWAVFGISEYDNPVAKTNALVLAIVTTYIAVLFIVLALTIPIVGQILGALIALVNVILFFAGEETSVEAEIAKFFYQSNYTTKLKTFDFGEEGIDVNVQHYLGDGVLLAGAKLDISSTFKGWIEKTEDGDRQDLEDSWIWGEFRINKTGQYYPDGTNFNGWFDCSVNAKFTELVCENDIGIRYYLQAGINHAMAFNSKATWEVRYEECGFYVFCEDFAEREDWTSPGKPKVLYFDVLPDSLDGIWNFTPDGVVLNDDLDGDGLTAADETSLHNTSPDDWDSDDDGLSDKFELDRKYDPTSPDSDSDGLEDGLEVQIGTNPIVADTDGDGLDDGLEVFHPDSSGVWSGGWDVNLPDTSSGQPQTARVFSNPVHNESFTGGIDSDFLSDLAERNNNTSPFAYNGAPRLTLTASPYAGNPENGRTGLYASPGDVVTVTMDLVNIGPSTISNILEICFPGQFSLVTPDPALSGGSNAQTQTGVCGPNSFLWDLGESAAANLTFGEQTTINFAATLDQGGSATGQIFAIMGYDDQNPQTVNDQLDARLTVIVDDEDPNIQFDAPQDGVIIGGGVSTYNIGTTATDASSWISQVEILNLPAGTGTAIQDPGTSQWLYQWNIDPDGGDDGAYNLTARAHDYLGNTFDSLINIKVDNTGPNAVILSPANNQQISTQGTNPFSLAVSGTANDTTSNNVQLVQISIDGRPWQEVTLTGTSWNFNWQISSTESAQGEHSLRVRALDVVGNWSDTVEHTVTIDVVRPTSELTDQRYLFDPPNFASGETVNLLGVANDAGNAPLPSLPAELSGILDGIQDATIWLEPADTLELTGGVAVTWLGDVNGDRLADLAIGLPASSGSDRGKVSILYGQAGDWAIPPVEQAIADSLASYVGVPGAGIGLEITAAGDVNGDGLDDMLIGDVTNNRVYLILGNVNGIGQEIELGNPNGFYRVITLPAGTTLRGTDPAGDINGDGLADFFIHADTGTEQAFLLLGHLSWPGEITGLNLAAAVIDLTSQNDRILGVGDMDGDQFDEFVVASGNAATIYAGMTLTQAQNEPASGFTTTVYTGNADHLAPLGDINLDGFADFAFGGGGAVQVVKGSGGSFTQAALPGISSVTFLAGVSNVHDISGDPSTTGRNDLLVGDGNDARLYIGDGNSASGMTFVATLTEVSGAANAPYTAGADLSADGSADLLVIPISAATGVLSPVALPFGPLSAVDPGALPNANGLQGPRQSQADNQQPDQLSANIFVDDDLSCNGNVPCHATVQAGLNAASPGDSILVYAGVYGPFTVSTDNVTVAGVNADAVFIDGAGGSFAASIQNADGVRLEKLTLQNASDGILLANAGVGGYADANLVIILDRLFLRDFTHALTMDRSSTARMQHSTLVGLDGSPYINISGTPDPAFNSRWFTPTVSSLPANGAGGGLVSLDNGSLYAIEGKGTKTILELAPGASAWTAFPNSPQNVYPGSVSAAWQQQDKFYMFNTDFFQGGLNGPVYAVEYVSDNEIYVGGDFTQAGGLDLVPNYIAKWNGTNWESFNSPFNGPSGPVHALLHYVDPNTQTESLYVGGEGGLTRYRNGTFSPPPHYCDTRSCLSNQFPNPNYGISRVVYALALDSTKNRVYVGGQFNFGGLAYVDLTSDEIKGFGQDVWSSSIVNLRSGVPLGQTVYTIRVKGDNVLIGGAFSQIHFMPGGLSGGVAGAPNFVIYNENQDGACFKSGDLNPGRCWSAFGSSPNNGFYLDMLSALGGGFNGAVLTMDYFLTGGFQYYFFGGVFTSPATRAVLVHHDFSNNFFPATDLNANGIVRDSETIPFLGQNEVYIAGDFTQIDGTSTNKVGVLEPDLSGIRAVPGTINGNVHDVDLKIFCQVICGYIYIGGDFTSVDSNGSFAGGFTVAKPPPTGGWEGQSFYEVTQAGSYTAKPGMSPQLAPGSILVGDEQGRLYFIRGGTNLLYRYDITSEFSIPLQDLPQPIAAGASGVWVNGALYVLTGGANSAFYRYDPADNFWYSTEADKSYSIAWGDVDGDGDLDLAVGNFCEPNRVYTNQGTVLETTASWVSNDSDCTRSVAWGDVDGDGDLDLAVGNANANNKVFLNVGGVLQTSAHWNSGENNDTQSLVWGDVNGDGNLDLAAGNRGSANKLYLNLGGGVLQTEADNPWSAGDVNNTTSLAWGDVDGDGDLDLAVGNQPRFDNGQFVEGDVKVYLNQNGVLQTLADNPWSSGDNDYTNAVAWGDVDGDGDLDLAVGNYSGSSNKVYLNQGGILQTSSPLTFGPNDDTYSVAWGDVDGDGDLDIAVGNGNPSLFSPNKLYLNQGGVIQTTPGWVSGDNYETFSVAWADVDGDGDLDLAAGNFAGIKNQVYPNQGSKLTSVGENPWSALPSVPMTVTTGVNFSINPGSSLVWDGADTLYLTPAEGTVFLSYHLVNQVWQVLGDGDLGAITPNDLDIPAFLYPGSGMTRLGDTLYLVPGRFPGFHSFSPVGFSPPVKLNLDSNIFVADPNAGSQHDWISIDPLAPYQDFTFEEDGNNVWVEQSLGTNWSPGIPASITPSEAAFLDQNQGLYRLTAASATAIGAGIGYHTYQPDVRVSTAGCAGCIQTAIDSGANRVLVDPGVYPENIYLPSGVTLQGADAGSTLITGSGAQATVSIEGVFSASLAGLSIVGNGTGNGINVEDGAKSIRISRSIVRGHVAGLAVDGANTDVQLVNNTIVENNNGLDFTNNAPVDVRNSIIAFNAGTGLSYQATAATQLHNYNLYWLNGSSSNDDLIPANPGAGELFLDPLFVDQANQNYQTLDQSPVIDAGNPGDPAPPGTGNRVDIGYVEQGRASFYADNDYCDTCPNDGLTWDVDAFDSIQDALNAAGARIQLLYHALEDLSHTVGVAPGTYTETLQIPSHVNLVGSGPEQTILVSSGGASVVSIDHVIDVEVSGFKITGGANAGSAGIEVTGPANLINIHHNLITGNQTGIEFSGGASGAIQFNTFVNNLTSQLTSGGSNSWVSVENNILASGGVGMRSTGGGRLFHDYNLFFGNTSDFDGQAGVVLSAAANEILGQDPLFTTDGLFGLQSGSPALDAAEPLVPAPTGGGQFADLGYSELRAAPLAIFMGDQDNSKATANSGILSVEYSIEAISDPTQGITETLPATWTTVPPGSLSGSAGDTVRRWTASYLPQSEGLYRIYTRATDSLNNTETISTTWFAGSFIADFTSPVVSWTPSPAGITSSPFELRASVSDYAVGEFNIERVYFLVDGVEVEGQWAPVPWDPAAGQARVFRAWIQADLNATPNVQAFAVDKAGNVGQTASESFTIGSINAADTNAPSLTVTSPGADVQTTAVLFSGTAADGESGLMGVEISLDGGFSWIAAALGNGNIWQLNWPAPTAQEFLSYPVEVVARDKAGNQSFQTLDLTIDNAPPSFGNVNFNPASGSTIGASGSQASSSPADSFINAGRQPSQNPLTITWDPPQDGSGIANMLIVVDQFTDTVPGPSDLVTGTSYSPNLTQAGAWYVHMAVQDQHPPSTGNTTIRHFGPWYVRNVDVACNLRQQSILMDGLIDLDGGEWSLANEQLDDDERPQTQQAFYANWDHAYTYLGWQGALWDVDGTLWIYLDISSGGSNQAVDGKAFPGSFLADVAVEITGSTSADGFLWRYQNQSWSSSASDPDLTFTQHSSAGTEIRLPYGTDYSPSAKMLAFAENNANQVWSVFPTTNSLAPAGWTDVFDWPDRCSTDPPNNGQPRGLSVDLAMTSAQPGKTAWGPGDPLNYQVTLTNREDETVTGLQLNLSATTGLTLSGSVIAVPDIAPGQSHTANFSGVLGNAGALNGISTVTAMATLSQPGSAPVSYTHRVDAVPPTLSIAYNSGQTIGTGTQTISGSAGDGTGSGVSVVQYSLDSGNSWQNATSSSSWALWTIQVPVVGNSGDSWIIDFQALDYRGNTIQVAGQFTVDASGPAVTIAQTIPAVLNTRVFNFTGNVTDDSSTNLVEFQIKSGTSVVSPWRKVSFLSPATTSPSQQSWVNTWKIPPSDGGPYTLEVRATDAVGNQSAVVSQLLIVDNIQPVLSTTQLLTQVALGYYRPPVPTGPPVLSGTVTDGGGMGQIIVSVTAPDGTQYEETADLLPDGTWSYTPILLTIKGTHTLAIRAVDAAGNVFTNPQTYSLLATNTPPDAMDDDFITDEDTILLNLDLLADNGHGPDSDFDGDTLTVTEIYTTVTTGTVSLDAATGLVDYDPNGLFEYLGVGESVTDTFSYRIEDGNGDFDTATVTVTVNGANDNPLITDADLTLDLISISENDSVNLSGSFIDIDANDSHTVTVVWGDGAADTVLILNAGERTFSASHQYLDDNPTATPSDLNQITVTVDDGYASASAAASLTVSNLDPVLSSLAVTTAINENGTATLTGDIADTGTLDSFTLTVDWGDSSGVETFSYDAGTTSFSETHQYLDDNPSGTASDDYTVSVTLTDDDMGSTSDSATVTVSNVDPLLSNLAIIDVDENGTATLTGDIADTGTLDSFTLTVDWGDSSGVETFSYDAGTTSFSETHKYLDDNPSGTASDDYTVLLTLLDDDTGSDLDSTTVTVSNVDPALSVSSASQSVQYSDPITDTVVTAVDVSGDPLSAAVSWNFNAGSFAPGLPDNLAFTQGGCVPTASNIQSCSWTLSGIVDVAPGTYTVRVTVDDDDLGQSTIDITITVVPEDAQPTYTGPLMASTTCSNCSTVTIPLRVTVQDISAVAGDPASDPDPGEIIYADVTFVDRDNGDAVLCSTDTITLFDPGDPTTGTATCDWTADIGNNDGWDFTVGTVIGGYYTQNSVNDDTIISVFKPGQDFVTGGGYMLNEQPGGLYGGDEGLKSNFGFHFKWNKNGRKLQGRLTLIVRQGGRVYQIRTNALNSMVSIPFDENDPLSGTAEIFGKANVQDVTDPLNPISIDGNATVHITLQDKGEPGDADVLAITVWDKDNILLYSSYWNGIQTLEWLIAKGNLQVH